MRQPTPENEVIGCGGRLIAIVFFRGLHQEVIYA